MNCIEELEKIQSIWIYLEAIFSQIKLRNDLKQENEKFQEASKLWQVNMKKISENPNLLELVKEKQLLEDFISCNNLLDCVQKGINDYLESKRQKFPRFYFISNDELLEILIENQKNPQCVQPYLKKCFEGIDRLKFDEDKKISGMYSQQGEYIAFNNAITQEEENIDQMLTQVETSMRESIKTLTLKYFQQYYSDQPQAKWLIGKCQMATLCVSQINWTQNAEKMMIESGVKGLEEFFLQGIQELENIVQLIRTNLTPLDRDNITSLIVLNVHARDVIEKLINFDVTNPDHFVWQSQLRFYNDSENIEPRMINTKLTYNYEYLGNSPRLVITPLTERCYITICGAIKLNYGASPQGPAGTGKTETVKDLAKALAQQCIVFNCSDSIDYLMMAKCFKGLVSSGSWICFDEFNRIDIEVISVIAQQIKTIQEAKTSKATEFVFEGSQVKLLLTCNIFVTMNPGYAGRTELPDNLKALFRPISMMIPDYALILEILLFANGFINARFLAKKIVSIFKQSSEQLSRQCQYDFGMRAIKSVATYARILRQKYPYENEDSLIIRSINQINLPKFISNDIKLFKNILTDQFPNMIIDPIDDKRVNEAIDEEIEQLNLSKFDYFSQKVLIKLIQLFLKVKQLYELTFIRSGIILVGPPSGKTSIMKTLTGTINKLEKKSVEMITINPKSITINQLYGCFNEATKEWNDGLFTQKFRQFAQSQNDNLKLLHLDGPIDAIWIENLNVVLDDNQKLCLNSGEIIKMNQNMRVIFETLDLLNTSPASVSRCGIIYMEPNEIGWRPLYQVWRKTISKVLNEEELKQINQLFVDFIDPTLQFIHNNCQEVYPIQEINLVQSLMNLFGILLKDLELLEIQAKMNFINSKFAFALIWSLGGSIMTMECRKKLDEFVKKQFLQKKINLPENGLLYDYTHKKNGEWCQWTELIEKQEKNPQDLPIHKIFIKTADTIKYQFLIKNNILHNCPTILYGPTGTGKSMLINTILSNELPSNDFSSISMNFSGQTRPKQIMDIVNQKLEKINKNQKCIMFIDDLNMPQREVYGAQPPIELLRQFITQGGWYESNEFQQIKNLQLIGAMQVGRPIISPRMTRNFNLISILSFDDQTLNRIFSTIINSEFLQKNFSEEILKTQDNIVSSTIDIYNQSIINLQPSPLKPHYTFNLSDIFKVIQGVCSVKKEAISNQKQIVKLWVHEIWRVFGDRLINNDDKLFMLQNIKNNILDKFKMNIDDIKANSLEQMNSLMFSDITNISYQEIMDQNKIQQFLNESLSTYNSKNAEKIEIILFEYAIQHLITINRILKTPCGNALLIGLPGHGKQSLTKLAAAIQNYELFSINITFDYGMKQWRDDIKKIMIMSGAKNQQTVFLFNDKQIKYEGFLEDINNLLKTGEVSNLFSLEEKLEIIEMIRKQQKITDDQLYNQFIDHVKTNLHIILCFSPLGETLAKRIKMFPSLVNCCTIDYFTEWPKNALEVTAEKFFNEIEINEQVKKEMVQFASYLHQSSVQQSEKINFTPLSYIELLNTFKNLLNSKTIEIQKMKQKYENGQQKIKSMIEKITGILPKQTESIKSEKENVEKFQEENSSTIARIQEAANKVQTLKQQLEEQLGSALPSLQQAQHALQTIKKSDLSEIVQYKNPPVAVKNALQACCYLLNPNPTQKKKNPKTGKMETDWWAASQQLIQKYGLDKFLNFDASNISLENMEKLQQFLNDPEIKQTISIENLTKVSFAAKSLIQWVTGICKYNQVFRNVKSLQDQLQFYQEKLNKLEADLPQKQEQLKEAEQKANQLQQYTKDGKENSEEKQDLPLKKLNIIEQINQEKKNINKLQEQISNDMAIIQTTANDALVLKDQCQQQLSEVFPILQQAMTTMQQIDKNQLVELKMFKNPPVTVKNVLQACCYLLNPKPTQKQKNPKTGKMETDWWAASFSMLNDMHFLQKLMQFDKDNISQQTISALEKYMNDPQIKPTLEIDNVRKTSRACEGIMLWVKGIYEFYQVNKNIKTKKQRLDEIQEQLKIAKENLPKKEELLKQAKEKMNQLNEELQKRKQNNDQFEEEQVESSQSQQIEEEKRDNQLENLQLQNQKWQEIIKQINNSLKNLPGDLLISSGIITYFGGFSQEKRSLLQKQWTNKITEMQIPISQQFSLEATLIDPQVISEFKKQGLPSDSFSIKNAIIVQNSRKQVFCIDPQGIANKWIKEIEKESQLAIIKLNDCNYLKAIENKVQEKKPILLENVNEELDSSMQQILMKQKQNGLPFYITTKLANINFQLDQVAVVNFRISQESLSEQLLEIIVEYLRPDLIKEQQKLLIENEEKKKIEEKILDIFSQDRDLLADENVLKVISDSKKYIEIGKKQQENNRKISEVMKENETISQEAASLFFCISELSKINHMYQYSLSYFIDLFKQSIINKEDPNKINKEFVYSIYCDIISSLFEKDKLLFQFLVAINKLKLKGQFDEQLLQFFCKGGMNLNEELDTSSEAWLSDKMSKEICILSQFKEFQNFEKEFLKKISQWKLIYNSDEPQKEQFPGEFTAFQKLVLIRCLRKEKLIPAIYQFITETLGNKFSIIPNLELSKMFPRTKQYPMMIIMVENSDPDAMLKQFAQENNKEMRIVCLGQGQSANAENMIKQGQQNGWWILLKDCHLGRSFMPRLEKIVEGLKDNNIHEQFRLFLTSHSTESLPVTVIQASIKMAIEPAKGFKQNMIQSYLTEPIPQLFENCQQPQEFKRLIYAICFFHSVLQERKNYGSIGFNISYPFNQADLKITVQQLKMHFEENQNTNQLELTLLNYLAGECNYGGRVTDDFDRRLVKILIDEYYCAQLAQDQNYKFTEKDVYKTPNFEKYEEYLEFIQQMPVQTSPQILGLHSNAAIIKDLNEAKQLLNSILICQSSKIFESYAELSKIINEILKDFPQKFNIQQAFQQYPIDYSSMNATLHQELQFYNELIKIIRDSLQNLKQAVEGNILMTPEQENLSQQLFDGKVPDYWLRKSYPSLKPLGSYLNDLKARIKFFQDWLDKGEPNSFWISGFFFPQGFLLAIQQQFARKYQLAINQIAFNFKVINQEIKEKPYDGVYIYGLFLEGAKWNKKTNFLEESHPKVLFTKFPNVLITPYNITKCQDNPLNDYDCPVYKTLQRKGCLSATGHLTNFIMTIKLPSQVDEKQWVKRGTALITQLDD